MGSPVDADAGEGECSCHADSTTAWSEGLGYKLEPDVDAGILIQTSGGCTESRDASGCAVNGFGPSYSEATAGDASCECSWDLAPGSGIVGPILQDPPIKESVSPEAGQASGQPLLGCQVSSSFQEPRTFSGTLLFDEVSGSFWFDGHVSTGEDARPLTVQVADGLTFTHGLWADETLPETVESLGVEVQVTFGVEEDAQTCSLKVCNS